MNKVFLGVVGVIIIVVGVIANASLFTVYQTQQALVLQFGNPVRVESTPGLKFKLPFVQNVEYYDARILDLDPPVQEVTLVDQKRVNVDAFARYKIVNPLEFRKKAFTDLNFRNIFGDRLNSAVRAEIGKIFLGDMLTEKRLEVMKRITDKMGDEAPEFGVEVVDVRIGRTDLPATTAQAVYNRMRSDRIATAKRLRSEGEEKKLDIQANADKQRVIIESEAKRKSEILRGEGDGEKTRILNDAYGQDQAFFDFYRSMDVLGKAIDEETMMVLSPDSDLFQFFGNVPKMDQEN